MVAGTLAHAVASGRLWGVHPTDLELVYRILVGFGLAFVIGFERELRGSVAGDRTFALIGGASAAAASVTAATSPQALAGIITGVGFIGGGLILRSRDERVHGVTTAATVFATAAMGLVVGLGHLLIGCLVAALAVLALELRFLPGIRMLDARRYQDRFGSDEDPPRHSGQGRTGGDTRQTGA